MTIDVFDNNNGIINQHPDTESQSPECKHINGIACDVKSNKSCDNREGNGQCDCKCGPPVAEKYENKKDSKKTSDQRIVSGLFDYFLNHIRLVHSSIKIYVGRDGFAYSFEFFFYCFSCYNSICS